MRQAQIIRTNYHTLYFLWRRYLVHHEQDSKTNTVDTKEDAVMIKKLQEHVQEKGKDECEEYIPDSIKDQDGLQEEEEEDNSPNNLNTAKSTANLLFRKTATTPNTVTTSKKKEKRRKRRNGLNSPEEARERRTQP